MQTKDLPVKTGGIKYDHGKPRPDLVFNAMARALLEVSKVATMGAAKYDDDNWLIVEEASQRYRDAKHRHMLLSAIEEHDKESGLSHLAHEAWNALAVLELHIRNTESFDFWLPHETDECPVENEDIVDAVMESGRYVEHKKAIHLSWLQSHHDNARIVSWRYSKQAAIKK